MLKAHSSGKVQLNCSTYDNLAASGALFVVGFLGSIALIVVGAVLGKQSTSWLVYLALFPGLLIYGILCYWKRRDR